MLTHVNYRTGHMHDMAALTTAAHAAGALTMWDLAHSAGAVPVDLNRARRRLRGRLRLQVPQRRPGCAGVRVGARAARGASSSSRSPAGWATQRRSSLAPRIAPAAGITRALCGTPPVLSMAALECGVDTLLAAEPLRRHARAARQVAGADRAFTELVDARCADHGFVVVSPRVDAQRGSQVCLTRDEGAYAIVQALIARGVIGDFRAGGLGLPDILRFGFTPLTCASSTCGTRWSTCAR